ncbi:MAG TPA: OmpW family outer membrane protein [Thermoanaerobaculia bacterium]|jgi:outer membrane protein W
MTRRILFFLFLLAGLRVSAQNRTDITVWSVGSLVDNTQIQTGSGTNGLFFKQKPGFGLSFNRYWNDHLSTEVSYMTFRGNMNYASTYTDAQARLGELEARTITTMAQWHFRTGMRVTPYLSGGIAHISGDFDPVRIISVLPTDQPSIELESNVTWTAAAGLDINLTDRWALSLEAKRVPWNAVQTGGTYEHDGVDIDPMLWGSGVRYRF